MQSTIWAWIYLLALAAVVLMVQLLICFKVKSLIIRIFPTALAALATVYLFIRASTAGDNLGYLIFIVYAVLVSATVLLSCGAAWGIWAAVKLAKRIRSK